MASITIRNLDESLKDALRRRAAGNRRSMEEEARQILKHAMLRERAGDGLGTRIHRLWADAGVQMPVADRSNEPVVPRIPFDDWPDE